MNEQHKIRLDILFSGLGFRRKDSRWSRKSVNGTLSSILLCEIQKSQNSSSFYLNFGVYYIGIVNENEPIFPASYDCHFAGRYEQILFNKGSSGINAATSDQEFEEILTNIKNKVIPFLETLTNPKYLKENFLPDYKLDYIWIQNVNQEQLIEFLRTKLLK